MSEVPETSFFYKLRPENRTDSANGKGCFATVSTPVSSGDAGLTNKMLLPRKRTTKNVIHIGCGNFLTVPFENKKPPEALNLAEKGEGTVVESRT